MQQRFHETLIKGPVAGFFVAAVTEVMTGRDMMQVTGMTVAPFGSLAAAADELGRVLLVDTSTVQVRCVMM